MARYFEAGRLARPQARAFNDAFLLSTPHPSGFARHLPRFVEKGGAQPTDIREKTTSASRRSWDTQVRAPLPQLCWGRWPAKPDGWGMARCLEAGRLARPQARAFNDAFLLSTPHRRASPATFPASRRRVRTNLIFERNQLPLRGALGIRKCAHPFPSSAAPGAGRTRTDGVLPAASKPAGLHDHKREPSTTHSCFPHPIRRASPATFPTSWRREGAQPPDIREKTTSRTSCSAVPRVARPPAPRRSPRLLHHGFDRGHCQEMFLFCSYGRLAAAPRGSPARLAAGCAPVGGRTGGVEAPGRERLHRACPDRVAHPCDRASRKSWRQRTGAQPSTRPSAAWSVIISTRNAPGRSNRCWATVARMTRFPFPGSAALWTPGVHV